TYPRRADGSGCGSSDFSETESSQKLPEMVVGYVSPLGRHTETFTSLVDAVVEKLTLLSCQGVVSTVLAVDTSKHALQEGSTRRSRGPLSEEMPSERTVAFNT